MCFHINLNFRLKCQIAHLRLKCEAILHPSIFGVHSVKYQTVMFEREMCPMAISKYFGDLVSNTSA
jgi:hypothetical protein